MISLAGAIALQATYQLWLNDNSRWPDNKMARYVFYLLLREELGLE